MVEDSVAAVLLEMVPELGEKRFEIVPSHQAEAKSLADARAYEYCDARLSDKRRKPR
jgi:hypothetical protein